MQVQNDRKNIAFWIRQTLISFAVVAFLIISCLAFSFFSPTGAGKSLINAVKIISESDFLNGRSGKNPDVIYEITRHSKADIAARDIDKDLIDRLLFSSETDARYVREISPLQQKQLALSILDNSTGTCRIYASAQTFEEPQGAYGLLATAINNAEERWIYILLHERSHCLWNATYLMEQILNTSHPKADIYQLREYKLAEYLGEAYADADTTFALQEIYPDKALDIAQSVCTWRKHTAATGMKHRTQHSVIAALHFLGHKPQYLLKINHHHRNALNAALVGMYYWLLESGYAEDEIAHQMDLLFPITAIDSKKIIDLAKQIPNHSGC